MENNFSLKNLIQFNSISIFSSLFLFFLGIWANKQECGCCFEDAADPFVLFLMACVNCKERERESGSERIVFCVLGWNNTSNYYMQKRSKQAANNIATIFLHIIITIIAIIAIANCCFCSIQLRFYLRLLPKWTLCFLFDESESWATKLSSSRFRSLSLFLFLQKSLLLACC